MSAATVETLLDAALTYARHGWPVFPLHTPRGAGCSCRKPDCSDIGKHPRIKGWQDAATTDETQIRDWWERRWPEANVGIPTGLRSGILVVDRDAGTGADTLETWQMEHGLLPPGPVCLTGGGGTQFYFAWTAGAEIRNSVKEIAPDIDIRGVGGLVVAPPSLHRSGKRYAWHDDLATLPPVPSWLLAKIAAASGGRTITAKGAGDDGGPIPEGRRNDTLAEIAGRLRWAGLSIDQIFDLLQGVNRDRCQPPLAEDEVGAIARSIGRYAAGDGAKKEHHAGHKNGSGPRVDDDETPAPPGWAEPEPLPIAEQPPFPTHHLPRVTRAWVEALAAQTQTPPDLPAMLTDGALAIALAKRVEVEVRPGWPEPLNDYGLVALDSGSRKSAVVRAIETPFKTTARAEAARLAPEIALAQAKRDVREKRLESLKKQLANTPAGDLSIEGDITATIGELLGADEAPVSPVYLVDDITPEKLGALLGEQGERMGVLSAEGGIFQVVAGRYHDGKVDGLDLFLNGYSGDSVPIHRLGRPTRTLESPALSLALAPQPEVVRTLARYPGFRGRGFLARFAYAIPLSTVGRRQIAAPPVPAPTRGAYEALIAAILALPGLDSEHSVNSVNARSLLTLRLSEDAQAHLLAFEAWLEPQLDADEGALGHIQDWASKLAGRAVRWAGRMHCAQHIQPGPEGQSSALRSMVIDGQTMAAAIAIAREYLIPHAETAFAMMTARLGESRAHRVLRVVRGWEQDVITRRDVWRRLCKSLAAVEDLDAPLALLVEHGYLRPLPAETGGPGRKPSPAYAINPLGRAVAPADRRPSTPETMDTSERVSCDAGSPIPVDRIDRTAPNPNSVNSVNRHQGFHAHHLGHLYGTATAEYWTHPNTNGVDDTTGDYSHCAHQEATNGDRPSDDDRENANGAEKEIERVASVLRTFTTEDLAGFRAEVAAAQDDDPNVALDRAALELLDAIDVEGVAS